MRALRLAQDFPRQARHFPRHRWPVRHAAHDRLGLERPQRRMGARLDAASGPGGHAEIPPARDGAGGGVRPQRDGSRMKGMLTIVGVILLLAGLVFMGQGSRYFPYPATSFM